MKKALSVILVVFGSGLAIFGVLPLPVYGIFNFFCGMLVFGGLFLIFLPILTAVLKGKAKIAFNVLLSIVAIGCLIEVALLLLAVVKSAERPASAPEAVIVMGCEVKGNKPSLMLRRRLEEALDVLEEYPDLPCIVSGGLGNTSTVTEAFAMKEWLIKNGIGAERIILEENAFDTDTNMQYCSLILHESSSRYIEVITVTDRFHQYRTSLYAAKYGLIAYPRNSASDIVLQGSYWVRETFALIEYYLFA